MSGFDVAIMSLAQPMTWCASAYNEQNVAMVWLVPQVRLIVTKSMPITNRNLLLYPGNRTRTRIIHRRQLFCWPSTNDVGLCPPTTLRLALPVVPNYPAAMEPWDDWCRSRQHMVCSHELPHRLWRQSWILASRTDFSQSAIWESNGPSADRWLWQSGAYLAMEDHYSESLGQLLAA